ncbi:MAG: TetR/AcrR family transcriptional regulator [Syntrophobacter sp.]
MKTAKLPRREREKQRQRQEMLEVALGLFSKKGYHQVSMHEIAEKSEFAIGTLYKFFQNKEELYRALVFELCDRFEDAIVKALEGEDDVVEKLRTYIRAKSEKLRSNLPFVRLFLAERRGVSFNLRAGFDEELLKRHYNFMERLAGIFESGINSKRFKNIGEPFYLAVALDSVLDSFLLLWLDTPERYPYPEDPDAILNIFFQGLVES